MSGGGLRIPTGRRLIALDLVMVVWVAVWAVLGMAVAREVRGISELSQTVGTVGKAIEESGRTLRELGSVPIVGGEIAGPAKRIEDAGRSVIASGRSSRESVRDLSLLLGLAIGLIPSLAPLAFYVPARIAHVRDRRALERLIEESEPGVAALLAYRAAYSMPYRDLVRHASDPMGELRARRYRRLALAELARHGVPASRLPEPPSARAGPPTRGRAPGKGGREA